MLGRGDRGWAATELRLNIYDNRATQGKWPVRTGIGRTQPAVEGRHACTVCVPLQSVCVPFQSVLGPLRQRDLQARRLSTAGCVHPMPMCTGHFPCARSRHQVNSSGNNDWVATAICMQGQENCLLDEPPDSCRQTAEAIDTGQLPSVPDELQCHLLPGGNRMPLKGVTIRPLSTNTLGLQTMEQS